MRTRPWMVVVSLVFAGSTACSNTSSGEAAFDFSTDSLCDWFTAAEMNQIIAAAQERAGTTWGFTYFEAGDCIPQDPYDSAAPWEWSPWLWATSRTGNPAPGLGLSVSLVPFAWVLPESLSYGGPAEVFVGHEMLDDSVTYGDLRYVSSWAEDMSVDLRVEGHEDEVLRFTLRHSNPGPAAAAETYDAQVALGFGVADAMLREMGWID